MSMFRCICCDVDFDSDFHEICKWDDMDVCKDCYLTAKMDAGLE